VVDPISTAVKAVEERLTSLESEGATVAEQRASRQSMEHELCVADDAGARTCISKAQLDRLLKNDAVRGDRAAASRYRQHHPPWSSRQKRRPPPRKPSRRSGRADKIETTTATAVEAPRQAEQAAAETLEPDSTPTGSIPAPESQGRALVTHPEVEITTRRPKTDRRHSHPTSAPLRRASFWREARRSTDAATGFGYRNL